MVNYIIALLSILWMGDQFERTEEDKPTIFLIGDSTVKNGGGKGNGGLWGWGDFLHEHFDTTQIKIENYARGGRSSRTYITEGLWDKVLERMKPGDFVIIQFGHNDGGKINDSTRARGTLKGIGEETEAIKNLLNGKQETVHTYGWYLSNYINDARAKGVEPIICSPVARNVWENGTVVRSSLSYALWASEIAKKEDAFFINLNERVAEKYEAIGQDEVTSKLFLKDHTHTTKIGAQINATCVAEGIQQLNACKLKEYTISFLEGISNKN